MLAHILAGTTESLGAFACHEKVHTASMSRTEWRDRKARQMPCQHANARLEASQKPDGRWQLDSGFATLVDVYRCLVL
ncbi:unnamed protein product [Protopolystoma xenopodis]|uniref:Uncharacterized protein n=1 Tax=Protopolystoma xenopodis TaxID=117903 RepID=A0A3S5FGF6_9PLAT|nr:unnamed protein product [Protopolystoma xenopodis]